MFKRLTAVLLCLLLLTACSAKPADKPLPECSALVDAIQKSQTFTEELMTLSEFKLLRALDLDEGSYTSACMAMDASRTTAEAIIVVTAKDAASAKSIAAKLEDYRASTLRQYKDYRPEEAPKLEAAKVLTHGLQSVLIICPDQPKAQTACENAWK